MLPWIEAVGFILFGFFIGTYGSMVGVGGGFFIVPVLLFLGYPSRIAAGTSLVVVLANSLSSSFSYLRQRRVDMRSALIFAAAGIPGAFLGAYAAQHVPRHLFSILFGMLLVLVALRSFFAKDPPPLGDDTPPAAGPGEITREFVDASGVRHSYRFNLAGGIAVSAVTGFLASLFGVGGGIVQVPAMVYLFHFPMHIAIATSQVIIAITAASGSIFHAYYGDIVPVPALFLSIGAIAGAQVGARLASRMHAVTLMRWLSLAVAAAAIFLIARS